MKICCYWTSCHVSFIWVPLFGNIRFKSEQNICMLDFWIFNIRRPRGLFIWCIRFSQIDIFSTLFSFYRPSKDRTKLALNLDSWKTIYLKIIALFLSFCTCTTFIFFSLRSIVSSGSQNIFRFLLFELVLREFFAFIFRCFLKCYPL